jgi:hypothetical protein
MTTTDPITPATPVSETNEPPAAVAESDACPGKRPTSLAGERCTDNNDGEIAVHRESVAGRSQTSEARRRANKQNAQHSPGPKTEEGKKRSSLNATRHGLLAQTLHLPEEDMAAYHEFTDAYVKDLNPAGVVETQLAHACADLQFRLNRIAAAEHNLFSIGHVENADLWDTGHPESQTALAFAETLRNSPDPLKLLSTYEQRLSRRFLQTLKQLREMQAERRALEQEHLESLASLASTFRVQGVSLQVVENLDPADYGFVCSKHSWQIYCRRYRLPAANPKHQKAQNAA